MKRVLGRLLIVCLLLLLGGLLGGAAWTLYQRTGQAEEASRRLSELSAEYGELSGELEELTGEHIDLAGRHSALSRGAIRLLDQYLEARGHGSGTTESFTFTESEKELNNPNRGFYHMHGFYITDSAAEYKANIAGRFAEDQGGLTLIEVNLRNFRKGEISAEGLENLDKLLEALAGVDKQLILRFLYDWDGKNLQSEPDSLDVILRHMEQVSDLLKKYEDRIFLVQGLFVGNYGEMNNSKYLSTEEIQALAGKLSVSVGETTYMAVRTPAQWRIITGTTDPDRAGAEEEDPLARLGLFNDGMLGSATDCGTYSTADQAAEKPFSQWSRREELSFQEALCRTAPNGGEVIIDNEYNDLENALEDMRAMHITYLNRDYDGKVLEKWRQTVVREEGCFDGMDGLTYVERHLGYRLVLREAALDYDWKTDRLTAGITLQNVGFAPVYREAQVKLVLYDRAQGREYAYNLDAGQDIRGLAGGTGSQEQMTLYWELPLGGLPQGELEVYFSVTDVLSGNRILLGNEQEPGNLGYRVGTLTLGGTEELREQLRQEFFGGNDETP
ncbi:MAG: DUF4832 domain-containing protein [Butyrivibrio sp.]|nr:DUF4832 domain-containing protein [Acetatifactor muris]MCM1559259.1 DUF4832 domain-containing protein [Butyrivibrio sp.]